MFLILVFRKCTLKYLEAKYHAICNVFSSGSEIIMTICIREREGENKCGKIKMVVAESVEEYIGIFGNILKTLLCFKLFLK